MVVVEELVVGQARGDIGDGEAAVVEAPELYLGEAVGALDAAVRMRKVIAVFGLSGVGKSTVVRRVPRKSGGLATAVNAGDLIHRRRSADGGRAIVGAGPRQPIHGYDPTASG